MHGFHVPVTEATSDDKYSTVVLLSWICAAPAKNYELAIHASLTAISLSQAARERSLLPGVVVFVPVYDADRQLSFSVSTGRPFYATPVSRHATYRSSGVTVISSWPCSQPLKLLRGAGRVVERFYCAAARVLFSVEG